MSLPGFQQVHTSPYVSSTASPHRTSPSPEHRPLPRGRSAISRSEAKTKTSQSFDAALDVSQREDVLSRQWSLCDYDVAHMMETLQMMQKEHLHDKAEIKALRKEMGLVQREFTEQRKLFQTAYQRKLARISEDLEKRQREWAVEREELRNHYEEMIEGIRAEHELELQEKEEQLEAAKQRIAHSPRIQDLEEKYRHTLAEVEKRHIEEITRLKAATPEKHTNPALFRKKSASSLQSAQVSVPITQETAEIEKLREANEELKRQLEEEQQRLAALQSHLVGSFRKKGNRALAQTLDPSGARGTDLPEGFEDELKSILGQINSHLENSDLFNSSCILADSLRNLCVKFDQLSSSSFIPL